MTVKLPGYRVVDSSRTVAEDGLRNDVAAFLGSTERGPMNVAVRVEGSQGYAAVFGGPGIGTVPRAVAAYLSNGGQVAWVVRAGRDGQHATGDLDLGPVGPDGAWTVDGPRRMTFPGTRMWLSATSPGCWAGGTVVRLDYRAYGISGQPVLDLAVQVPGLPAARRTGLAADELADALTSTGLVTVAFSGPPVDGQPADTSGPARCSWSTTLSGAAEPVIEEPELLSAVVIQAQIEEIALVCVPDLAATLGDRAGNLLLELAESAATTQDRLVVASSPATDAHTLSAWAAETDTRFADPRLGRAVAIYFPYLLAEKQVPTGPDRYSATDPVGHVCGRIAELDRERGSDWSPANTLVSDAIDTVTPLSADLQSAALALSVNLVRRRVGGGLELWGARTLDSGAGRYVAHRRLVHRIVRAARRVVEPLMFDTNDRLLWFSVARAISGILMEAFRSGALRGATPEQAYRVRCDETTNTPDAIDSGQVVCEIDLAPATPMEFITLRLTIGTEGLLEVVEQ